MSPVVGQSRALTQLSRYRGQGLLVLHGPRGVGKRTAAEEAFQTLHVGCSLEIAPHDLAVWRDLRENILLSVGFGVILDDLSDSPVGTNILRELSSARVEGVGVILICHEGSGTDGSIPPWGAIPFRSLMPEEIREITSGFGLEYEEVELLCSERSLALLPAFRSRAVSLSRTVTGVRKVLQGVNALTVAECATPLVGCVQTPEGWSLTQAVLRKEILDAVTLGVHGSTAEWILGWPQADAHVLSGVLAYLERMDTRTLPAAALATATVSALKLAWRGRVVREEVRDEAVAD